MVVLGRGPGRQGVLRLDEEGGRLDDVGVWRYSRDVVVWLVSIHK